MQTMAGLSKGRDEEGFLIGSPIAKDQREIVKHAARLFGLGYDRRTISKSLVDQLYPEANGTRPQKLKLVRARVRQWEKQSWFRDMVWNYAVVQLDMSTPAILHGVANKAKRGRVDAAKLALAITGRYVDKANDQPSAVTINLVGIPRPQRELNGPGQEELAAGEVVGEEVD